MKHILLYFSFAVSAPLFAQTVICIKVDGSINPSSAEFIHRGILKATQEKAECLIIHLNTPGGLLKSTRVIVGDILESPVPVVVYVSPGGAHAGSAGVFITLAAHIAAMTPGTNIGAAHPVDLLGGRDTVMNEKATNDAAAFIRTIAEKRKRNWQWAEDAVRKSLSVTESQALEKNVIDLVATNSRELLVQIDKRIVEVNSGTKTLQTKNASIKWIEMGTSEKILDLLSDPNVAYILMLLGLYGLMFELYNPGSILPGIVGVICMILAFYSMHTLPVNYAGVALIVFAIILFLLEIKIASHGVLAIGGIISLMLGSMMLIRSDSTIEFVRISWSVIISSTIITSFFFLFVIGIGLKAQRAKPVTGIEGLTNEIGESLETLDPSGKVWVHGEVWGAESIGGKIEKGEKVRITGVENLKLHVDHFIS
ncbi:MAG: nodulation protein NfeD [Bacteroidetes bacterium]|nr:nodulation protein NfeD [Bacteroidota bacterium]